MSELFLNNLSISINNKNLLTNFAHRCFSGKIFALTGNNGVGKTTMLKALAGLHDDYHGDIIFNGEDLKSLTRPMRAHIFSFLLQHSPSQSYCTAYERIAHGLMPIYGFNFFPNRQQAMMIDEVSQRLGIEYLLGRPIANLSGGEQRLVHMAKCLVNPHVKILVLDEPSVFLDFEQQQRLIIILKNYLNQDNLIIFSSHDAAFIDALADEVIYLRDQKGLVFSKNHWNSSFKSLLSNADNASLGDNFSYNTR